MTKKSQLVNGQNRPKISSVIADLVITRLSCNASCDKFYVYINYFSALSAKVSKRGNCVRTITVYCSLSKFVINVVEKNTNYDKTITRDENWCLACGTDTNR